MSATREEIAKRMRSDPQRVAAIHTKIVNAARPLIPVLLDAGRPNSAKELQELFFELDAATQEAREFVTENMEGIIGLLGELGREGGK